MTTISRIMSTIAGISRSTRSTTNSAKGGTSGACRYVTNPRRRHRRLSIPARTQQWRARGDTFDQLNPRSGGYAQPVVADTAAPHEISADVEYAAAVAMVGTGRWRGGPASCPVHPEGCGAGEHGHRDRVPVQTALQAGATVVEAAGGHSKIEPVQQPGATGAVDHTAADRPDSVGGSRRMAHRERAVVVGVS